MMNTRNIGIDFGRWIFSFLIVTLHMGMIGREYLVPLGRCGVPFFYMVSGYFLANTTPVKLLKTSGKWYSLWIGKFLILGMATVLIGGGNSLDIQSFVRILTEGFADCISMHEINGYHINVMVILWFMYVGATAMLILSFLLRLFKRKYVLSLLSLFVFLGPLINYVFLKEMPTYTRIFYLAIPFLSIGMLLKEKEDFLFRTWLSKGWFIAILIILCIGESLLQKKLPLQNVELFFLNIPLVVAVFIKLSKVRLPFWLEHFIRRLPVKTTMDVYIWHVFVQYVVIETLGYSLYYLSTPVVFTIIVIISVSYRKLTTLLNPHLNR